jgi:hypothetical protein
MKFKLAIITLAATILDALPTPTLSGLNLKIDGPYYHKLLQTAYMFVKKSGGEYGGDSMLNECVMLPQDEMFLILGINTQSVVYQGFAKEEECKLGKGGKKTTDRETDISWEKNHWKWFKVSEVNVV